jgi:tellurite resistance protein
MHDQDFAIVRALVPVAWADGVFADREKETLEALLDAFGADDVEKEKIRIFAETKKTLDDIDLQTLSADDRRILLQHAVLLSYADGNQDESERKFLDELVKRLKIQPDEAKAIMEASAARAKKFLNLLGS